MTLREWPSLVSGQFDLADDDPRFLPWLAAVDLAKQTGLPLWADDIGLRSLARDAGVPVFGTVALLNALEDAGQISSLQRRSAMNLLREEYCVDLELDVEWIRSSAAASRWRGGPVAVGFARPAIWADTEAAYAIWKDTVDRAAEADTTLVGRWVYAAATGVSLAMPSDRTTAVVATFIGRGIIAGRFQPTVFSDCLAAGREACDNQAVGDPLAATLRLLFAVLEENLGRAGAAEVLLTLGKDLDGDDRVELRRIIFGVEGTAGDR
jgi:hypothetical protein